MILAEELIPPRQRISGTPPGWMITRFPSSAELRSKTLQQDHTVQIGVTCLARRWIESLCHMLLRTPLRRADDPRLLQTDQRSYTRLLAFATKKAALPPATLHMLRHGGASMDGSLGLSDLSLQERGGWESISSVQRYRSAGRLLRRTQRVSRDLVNMSYRAPGIIVRRAAKMLQLPEPLVTFPEGYS